MPTYGDKRAGDKAVACPHDTAIRRSREGKVVDACVSRLFFWVARRVRHSVGNGAAGGHVCSRVAVVAGRQGLIKTLLVRNCTVPSAMNALDQFVGTTTKLNAKACVVARIC